MGLSFSDIVNSVAGGAHYSGAPISDSESENGDKIVAPPGKPTLSLQGDDMIRDRIMADLKELYCCRPSKEIFERTWRPDAVFEVSLLYIINTDSLILVGPLREMRGLRAVCSPGASF